jgi:phenylpropionate dioxygenase-like ring-hydroxylating dioxygenase large terminal subunit
VKGQTRAGAADAPERDAPIALARLDRDFDHLVREDRVHRAVYTDPEIFTSEMLRVFGGTWTYLAHESEIPEPGDFRTARLGLRPLVLVRDASGRVHALFNRCMHRGATVCRVERGSASHFQCPYHGWTYRNDGRLTGLSLPKGYGPDFDRSQFDLRRVPLVESYRGFLFGTVNPDAPPLLEFLAGARDLIDQWLDRYPDRNVIVRSAAHRMVYRGNWKLALDNAIDGYHPPFSHRSLLEMAAERAGGSDEGRDMQWWSGDVDESPMYVQALGNGHTFADQRPAVFPSAWAQQRPQPGREAYEAALRAAVGDEKAEALLQIAVGSQMNLNVFPNLLLIGSQIQVIEPIAPDRTQLTWYATTISGVPDEVNVLRMRSQEDFLAFGEPDDQANFEECQRGLSIPEIEWIDFRRHAHTGTERRDERGVVTGPVTDELGMRHHYEEWKRLMTVPLRAVTN